MEEYLTNGNAIKVIVGGKVDLFIFYFNWDFLTSHIEDQFVIGSETYAPGFEHGLVNTVKLVHYKSLHLKLVAGEVFVNVAIEVSTHLDSGRIITQNRRSVVNSKGREGARLHPRD